MKRLIIVTLSLMVLFGLSAIPSVASTFTPITQPDAAYLVSTTKIDISGLTFGSSYSSISDGALTVSFDKPLQKLGPVPTGWNTWSSPPYSESANPDVLYTGGQYDLTMTLSQPCTTFGFELEPNPYSNQEYDVDFILMSGPTVVGTITMTVHGYHGARLFAAKVDGGSFDKMVIEGSREFAIAQIRYTITTSGMSKPVPGKIEYYWNAFRGYYKYSTYPQGHWKLDTLVCKNGFHELESTKTVDGVVYEKWGEYHGGIDIFGSCGVTPVKAAAAGEVIYVDNVVGAGDRAGKWIVIGHGEVAKLDGTVVDDISTRYLHLDTISEDILEYIEETLGKDPASFAGFINPPLPVDKDSTIGMVGMTGCDVCHLHFEVRQGLDYYPLPYDTWPLDPCEFVDYEGYVDPPETAKVFASCPVDLIVTDPDGLIISREVNQLPGLATHIEVKYQGDILESDALHDYEAIVIDSTKIGDYIVRVIPEPGAGLGDVYNLVFTLGDMLVVLADGTPIADIPEQGYIIRSTGMEIIQIIPATVDFDPNTLNLKSVGKHVTAYIELPLGCDITQIDVSSISLNGTAPALTKPTDIGDYDEDGIPDLMVKFDASVVQSLFAPGDQTEIAIIGEVAGIAFEGADTIRVIDPTWYGLDISSTTGGLVTVPGEGTFSYKGGTVVNLVAVPASCYHFVNWTGDISTIGDPADATSTIVMNGDYDIVANFETLPPQHKIAFTSRRDGNEEIYIMNVNGSNQINLTNHPAVDFHPTLSPDCTKIAFDSTRDGNEEIYVMNADGTNPVRLTTNPLQDMDPEWSPDGTKIAFTSDSGNNYDIWVMNADGSNKTRITDDPAVDRYPTWSPDGGKIAFTTWRQSILNDAEIYVMNADGSNQTNLTNNPSNDQEVAWSPDGQKIAFSSTRDGNWEVYVMNADGSSQTQITNIAWRNINPVWSPDGTNIVFASDRQGPLQIYIMNPDGSSQTRLTDSGGDDFYPTWR